MKVLAIDPGYGRLGVAVVERLDGKDHLAYSTCIETNSTDSFPERLFILGQELEAIFSTHRPDMLAIETLFFNKNVKTAIDVAQARGIILYLGKLHGCTIFEYGPQEIKVAVTGYGKSDKAAVISMVRRLIVGVPEQAHDDEYDAIAVGITALACAR